MSDKPEFDQLIERHGEEIFAYLWRLLRFTADAEDCFQETFFKGFKAFPRLQPPANYRAWLYRIATNTANSFLARQARLAKVTADLNLEILSDGPATAEIVDQRIALARVYAAVEKLPPKQRAALILRKYQGLSYNEIGESLATSTDSARAHVYQALKKLRAELAPHQNDTEG